MGRVQAVIELPVSGCIKDKQRLQRMEPRSKYSLRSRRNVEDVVGRALGLPSRRNDSLGIAL